MKKRELLLLRAIAVAAGAVLVTTVGAQSTVDSDAHATHNVPGIKLPYPLAHKVRHVGGDNDMTGGHVVVEGERLYVGAYGMGLRIFDISDRESPREIGAYLPGGRADAPPDAAVFDGRHIAVLNGTRRVTATDARTDRTEFLDVTNPAAPRSSGRSSARRTASRTTATSPMRAGSGSPRAAPGARVSGSTT